MAGLNTFSVNSGLISAGLLPSESYVIDVLFYINLVMVFCAIIEITTFIVLCRKTVYAVETGLVSIALLVFGFAAFIIQLVFYVYDPDRAVYAVYVCFALLACGFIGGSAYCFVLSGKSNKKLCILTGALNIIPPVGAVLTIILSYRIHVDTRVQELVYSGYAYTYAELGAFCAKHKPSLIDASGSESMEPLTRKEAKARIKALKNFAVNDAEAIFNYSVAIAYYTPEKMRKAIKLMRKSAGFGYAAALFNLGFYYETGTHVRKDRKKARDYYQRAAEAGDKDAALRLGIMAFSENRVDEGVRILEKRVEKESDIYAKYNLGVCAELGLGEPRNIDKAVEIYAECAHKGLFIAQKRIFALASTNITSPQNGDFFRRVTDRGFDGTFGLMIDGLIEIKKRHAADAADFFLQAVKCRDKWEGIARCLVGTLYIDRGKLQVDKQNGADYIKSAFDLNPGAKDIYSVVPKSLSKKD